MTGKRTNSKRDLNLRLGIAVRRLRQQAALSQTELARTAGITQPALSMIEGGKRTNLNTLEQVARALDRKLCEMIWLAERPGDKKTVIREAREFFRDAQRRPSEKLKAR